MGLLLHKCIIHWKQIYSTFWDVLRAQISTSPSTLVLTSVANCIHCKCWLRKVKATSTHILKPSFSLYSLFVHEMIHNTVSKYSATHCYSLKQISKENHKNNSTSETRKCISSSFWKWVRTFLLFLFVFKNVLCFYLIFNRIIIWLIFLCPFVILVA